MEDIVTQLSTDEALLLQASEADAGWRGQKGRTSQPIVSKIDLHLDKVIKVGEGCLPLRDWDHSSLQQLHSSQVFMFEGKSVRSCNSLNRICSFSWQLWDTM